MAQYQQISSILTTEITTCVRRNANHAFAEHQLSHALTVRVCHPTQPVDEPGVTARRTRHRVKWMGRLLLGLLVSVFVAGYLVACGSGSHSAAGTSGWRTDTATVQGFTVTLRCR